MELHLDRPGLLDGELRGDLVCVDEAAHAELYAAEVARHDDERIGHLVALYHAEYRAARRAGGLARVGAVLERRPRPYPVGPAVVVGLRVDFGEFLYNFRRLVGRKHGAHGADEARALLRELRVAVRARRAEGRYSIDGHIALMRE